MIKLIGNELYKVFHKRATIVYLLIILFALLSMTYVNSRSNASSQNVYSGSMAMEQTIINSLKDRNDLSAEEKLDYIEALTNYDVYKFLLDRHYDKDSSEAKYVDTKLRMAYHERNAVKVYGDGYYTVSLEEANKAIEDAIKFLDNYDPIEEIKHDLNNIDKEEACLNVKEGFCDKYIEEYKKVLQYRIDMNIPYSYNNASVTLDSYLLTYGEFLYNDKNKDILRKEDLEDYKSQLSDVKVTQYLIDHKEITNDYKASISLPELIVFPFTELSFMVILGLILITSAILSDEFEKGTIKQLLVKPFNRSKILLSKFIACLISIVIIALYIEVLNLISYSITDNFGSITDTLVVYDWNLNKAIEVNSFQYLFEIVKLSPFMYINMTLLILLMSVVFTSTALSGAFGFALIIVPEILTYFITTYKWLAYLPFFTWDMTCYRFGGDALFEALNFKLQLGLNILYTVVFILISLLLFKKKDIKNQ